MTASKTACISFALWLILPMLGGSARASGEKGSGFQVLDQRQGTGEQCLVCGMAIHEKEVVEVRHQGRTFHVAAGEMFERFKANPEQYFRRIQARAALFDESGVARGEIGRIWLYGGVYLVIALLFAALCAYLAVTRAHPPLPWFFAGLVGNIFSLALLLIRPRGEDVIHPQGIPAGLTKVSLTRTPTPCPRCGAENHPAATVCLRCSQALQATATAETARI